MLITTTGRVEQRIVASGSTCSPRPAGPHGARARRRQIGGLRCHHLARAYTAWQAATRLSDSDATLTRTIATALADALVEEREERVVVAGTSHLARHGAEFTTTWARSSRPWRNDPPRLLGTAGEQGCARRPYRPREPHTGLHATSMVSTGYGSGSDLVAGLRGPSARPAWTTPTMAAVRAVATYVSRILDR